MEYVHTVKRMRMTAVLQAIDGGNSPGQIELRTADRMILATLIMQRPSFYLVGDDLVLTAPCTGWVTVKGEAVIGTITDGSGNICIDDMSIGVDVTEDNVHDYEIVLDDNMLEVGNQVTIVTATIEHG
jgi:hypothetical protein